MRRLQGRLSVDERPVVVLEEVSKSFGPVRAVERLTISIQPGRITGLLGRNGAGKTTTLRMINGIFLPDHGTITVFGERSAAVVRDRLGYLPEERGLYRKMKVLEQLLFLAEIKGRRPATTRARARAWLERFELWDKRDTKLEALSKGNQQKVQLIGALLHEPDLIILDEPTVGLDPVNVVLVRNVLRELREQGRTVLLSTHMMAEAEKLVDDIVLIHRGRAVLQGPLEDVRSSFGVDTVQLAFSGDGAFLADLPGVARARVESGVAELRLLPGSDPQGVLAAALGRVAVARFEVAAPSLEEIFLDRVGAAAELAAAAGEVAS
jgi:ABC-2 type transport system ATP-binding protein